MTTPIIFFPPDGHEISINQNDNLCSLFTQDVLTYCSFFLTLLDFMNFTNMFPVITLAFFSLSVNSFNVVAFGLNKELSGDQKLNNSCI